MIFRLLEHKRLNSLVLDENDILLRKKIKEYLLVDLVSTFIYDINYHHDRKLDAISYDDSQH